MAFALPTPRPCAECGEGSIFHSATYVNLAIDSFFTSLFPPRKNGVIARTANSIEYALGPAFLKLFVFLKLAQKITAPDKDTTLLGQYTWEAAIARGIQMWEWRLFGLARNVYCAVIPATETRSKREIAFEGMPFPKDEAHVWWMDEKNMLKKEFMARGIPVAKGGAVRSLKEARKLFATLTPPAIAKPASGSFSRHTVLHIMDDTELTHAFAVAHRVSPLVVIEEELSGTVYRVTVVNGKVSAALRRDKPTVFGDGVHTVRELVEKENENPLRHEEFFHEIKLEEPAKEELQWQHLTLDSVPEIGRAVTLHQKILWTVGGTTTDVTDTVHPDNAELFIRAAKELNAYVAGIDVILKDISVSWKEQERTGILECNSLPFIENHKIIFAGVPRDVAGDVWDMVLESV